MPKVKDLWGPPLVEPEDSAPVRLLKAQADALTERTKGRVVGSVAEDAMDGTAWTSLYAVVPALDDYRHKLLTIGHPLVVADPEDPSPLTVCDPLDDGAIKKLSGAREFEEWLGRVLSSPKIHNVIQNLLRYNG